LLQTKTQNTSKTQQDDRNRKAQKSAVTHVQKQQELIRRWDSERGLFLDFLRRQRTCRRQRLRPL